MPERQISLYSPTVTQRDILAVTSVLQSGWISSGGKAVHDFENALSEVFAFPSAVATSSGTSALQLALEALNVRGSEVLMPAMTFAAPASAIVRANAHPVFIDLEPQHYQLDVGLVERFLEQECTRKDGPLININTARRIGCICAVHLYGSTVDIPRLVSVANHFQIPVLHDAAQALGSLWENNPIGSALKNSATPHLAATSFNANKVITCGGGGALLGHDHDLLEGIRHIASTAKSHPIAYQHDTYGLNVRLSNINAALGHSQLMRIREIIDHKRTIAEEYTHRLNALDAFSAFTHHPASRATGWMNMVCIRSGERPILRIVESLSNHGVEARPIWTPLYELDIYGEFQRYPLDMPITSILGKSALMLPSGSNITSAEVDRVLTALERAI